MLPYKPKAGSLFIISSIDLKSKWKDDGHYYLKRKSGHGI